MNISASFKKKFQKPSFFTSNFTSKLPVNDEIPSSQNTPFRSMKRMISTICGSGA